jgi:hypothetical protein
MDGVLELCVTHTVLVDSGSGQTIIYVRVKVLTTDLPAICDICNL